MHSFILLNQPVNYWGLILCQERLQALPVHDLVGLSQPESCYRPYFICEEPENQKSLVSAQGHTTSNFDTEC